MAVGPTEALHAPELLQVTQTQVDISSRLGSIMNNAMRGAKTAKVSPESAIPPGNVPQKARTNGIGSQLDLEA